MNAYTGNEPYVFFSYSHADREKAEGLIAAMKKRLCRVFYDEGLSPGGSWNDELALRLKGASAMVLLLSARAADSVYVRAEINFAFAKGVRVFPVLLENFPLPDGLEMLLGTVQFTDISAEEDMDKAAGRLLPALPDAVIATRKTPFFAGGGYAFYLEPYSGLSPERNQNNCFRIVCRDGAGEGTVLFDFPVPTAAYDIAYTVTRCEAVRDDYFTGETEGTVLFHVLAGCSLEYPLYGPDFDMLLVFALRLPEGETPGVRLIDYHYRGVTQSTSTEGLPVGKSPWGAVIDRLCRSLLCVTPEKTEK